MTSSFVVRPARPEDSGRLVEHNLALALESEGRRLDPERVRRGVARLFAEPSRGAYRVVEGPDGVLGSLMLTREWSDWRDGEFWWIQSVFVVPSHRRRGVFRALYDSVLAEARENEEVCGVRLYVERENAPAIDVYEKVGMERSTYYLYEVDFVMGEQQEGTP